MIKSSSCFAQYIVAYLTATIVPMAVPDFCRKKRSPNAKMLLFMTYVSKLITVSVGKQLIIQLYRLMKLSNVSKPCLVSMFVYMETASAVISFVFGGRGCGIFERSSKSSNESLR